MSAEKKRFEPGAAPDVEHADALWRVQFVPGDAQKIDLRVVEVDRHLAGRLDRVSVEERSFGVGDPRRLFDRKDGAGFIVGPHDRDDRGVFVDGSLKVREIEPSASVHRKRDDFAAAPRKFPAVGVHSGVFDGGGDHLPAAGAGGHSGVECGIVAFRSAAGEDNFGGVSLPVPETGAEQFGHLAAGIFDFGCDAAAEMVNAGRIAIAFTEKRSHRLEHFRRDRRGRVVVQIDDFIFIHNEVHSLSEKTKEF